MRVVAGEAGGRPLIAPEGTNTRPTSDRVRESIFNTLFSLGATEGSRVVDLYAGSGALGIEALSRGAASCVFVEQDRNAVAVIQENLEVLGLDDRATVVQADVLQWLERQSPESPPFDLVLIDPPYADEPWEALLDAVSANIVVAESRKPVGEHRLWDVLRDKKYGATLVSVLTPKNSPADDGSPS